MRYMRSAPNGEITFFSMKPTLTCLCVVLPDDIFVSGFRLQLSSNLCQSYIPVRYRPIKYYAIGEAKCHMPRAARTAGPPLTASVSSSVSSKQFERMLELHSLLP